MEQFDFITRVGVYNRRRIARSNKWSQHSWANGLDLHVNTIAEGDELDTYLHGNREELGIRILLWRHPNHWDVPPPRRHVHVDFWPKGVQTPPRIQLGKGWFKYSNGSVVRAPIRRVPAEGEGVDDLAFMTPEAQQFWQAQYDKQKEVLDPPTNEDMTHTLVTHVRDSNQPGQSEDDQ